MPQEKTPLLQGSTVHTKKNRQIRMEKVSEIHLKEREEAYIGEILKIILIFRSFQKANPRFDQPRRISGNIFYEFAF